MEEVMQIRKLHPDDIPTLRAMYVTQGFEYEFPDLEGPLMERVLIAEDENGKILAAVAAERLLQIYLICGETQHPGTKLALIRAFHSQMAKDLKAKGYSSVEAFLPPPIAETFGGRLQRTFGWVRNWQSWTVNF